MSDWWICNAVTDTHGWLPKNAINFIVWPWQRMASVQVPTLDTTDGKLFMSNAIYAKNILFYFIALGLQVPFQTSYDGALIYQGQSEGQETGSLNFFLVCRCTCSTCDNWKGLIEVLNVTTWTLSWKRCCAWSTNISLTTHIHEEHHQTPHRH